MQGTGTAIFIYKRYQICRRWLSGTRTKKKNLSNIELVLLFYYIYTQGHEQLHIYGLCKICPRWLNGTQKTVIM